MDVVKMLKIGLLWGLLLPQFCFAGEWALAKDKNGIQVYLAEMKDSDIRQFKVQLTVDASLDTVIAVMNDAEACPRWFHQCHEHLVIKQISFHERYVYQKTDFPFPVDDRIVISHLKINQDSETKSIRVEMNSVADYCQTKNTDICRKINKQDGTVVTKAAGFYLFQPLTDNKTRILFQYHMEPAGALPKWLINSLLVDAPFNSMDNLRRMLKLEKYQQARLVYSSDGVAMDLIYSPDLK